MILLIEDDHLLVSLHMVANPFPVSYLILSECAEKALLEQSRIHQVFLCRPARCHLLFASAFCRPFSSVHLHTGCFGCMLFN
jgi:hypothetical protein